MATIDKLEYINNTKNLIKNALNIKFNSQIGDEDTFRSYAQKINDIYENWPKVSEKNTNFTLNSTKEGKMKIELKGNISQEGTPTPKAPQDIHVVSGDNEIIVKGNGKNLFNKDFHIINGSFINSSGGIASDSTLSYQDYFIEVEQNTNYTISSSVSTIYRIAKYDSSKNLINRPYNENASTSYTINTGNAKYIKMAGTLTTALNSLQIEKSSTATTYEAYIGESYTISLGNTELCKIGDYQDVIKRSSGKNLFDKTSNIVLDKYIGKDGTIQNEALNWYQEDYIEVKPSTNYIMSSNSNQTMRIALYDENKVFISRVYSTGSIQTATTATTKYIRLSGYNNINNNIILNEGSTVLPYEPYGTGWYVEKQIGKFVLDGTNNSFAIRGDTDTSGKYRFSTQIYNGVICNTTNGEMAYSNKMSLDVLAGTYSYISGKNSFTITQTEIVSLIDDISEMTLTNANDWLKNNNIEVYYPLSTPTYEVITNTDLINQLEALKGAKSYATQTNISQENNDKPFILDVSALKKNSSN